MEVDDSEKASVDQANSGDDTDVSPPAPDQTESGSDGFQDPWLESKCVFCQVELKEQHEPKLMMCLHMSCKNCLTAESSPSPTSTSIAGLSGRQLICPSCNQEVVPSDVVDHLFLLEKLSQNSEGVPEEKTYPCTSCEEGADATGFCQDCQEWLCDTCITAHHRVRVTKDHVIRPKEEMEGEKPAGLNQKYLFCPVHSHEPLKLYCETCDKLTCRDCQLSDHKDHKYQFLSNACEDEKNVLNSLLGKIKEKQHHIESACTLVNKRHAEIVDREQAVTQEIKTFAVKFITEINKRGKQLLQELADVCSNKKTQLSFKHQELINMGERLDYCLKFAESALSHGSETALVYSKKIITNQLRRILRHRCEVPNPQHMVDIAFSYEPNYLTQYISQMGTLLVDQQPVPRQSLPPQPQAVPTASGPRMLPPQSSPLQSPGPGPRMMMQSPIQNVAPAPSRQVSHPQQGVGMSPRGGAVLSQQIAMQQSPQQQKHQQYGQPQVTSSTDPAQNRNAQIRQQQMMNVSPQQQAAYSRNQAQRNIQGNVNQNQAFVNNNNNNQSFAQRQVTPQTTPTRQVPQQSNYQGQQQQQQHQQQPQQQQQQQRQQDPAQLQRVFLQNSNVTISTVPGPTPPKQRAIAPPPNLPQLPPGLQVTAQPVPQMQRVGTSQPAPAQQTAQRGQQPQVIVIDGDGPNKTPNMANTSRLSHFPAAAQAAMSANPGLQIQPINNFNSTNRSPRANQQQQQPKQFQNRK